MERFMFDYFPIDSKEFDGPVLVTGSSGCIGSWTVALLERAGVKVHAFDLKIDKRRPSLIMDDAALNNVVWHAGDIVDTAVVKSVVKESGVRAIIHLAALQVPFCRADPVAGALVNVVGTVNVFEAAKACGIARLTYASSVAAYGALENSGAMSTLYGAYKYCNEQTAKVYSEENGLHSVGIRPGVVYGVGRDQGMTSKTTAAILAAAAAESYTVPFSGKASWLFAGEAASAFIRAVAKPHSGAPVFDLNGEYISVEDGMAMLRSLVPNASIEVTGGPLAFPMDKSDDPLRAFVGDYGRMPLDTGIRYTYESFQHSIQTGKINVRDWL
ncbi:MAG: NAD(P)-dependent oxidoreductase [Planctomycetia bacterium]|nr:NAD(P)-dependent oxidoreductase [Planctomycetia bacterium]